MVFDAAYKKFVLENNPPATEKNEEGGDHFTCRYRTQDGRACAVGLCIPDGHPAQLVDAGVGAKQLADQYPELFEQYIEWDALQYCLHDWMVDNDTGEWAYHSSTKEQRKIRYMQTAKEHGLTIPE